MISKISLGLVDDHQIVIDGLLSLLKDEPQFEFAFATTCPKDVLQNLKTKPVDVLLTDVMMPELPGNVLAKEVKKEFPQTKILALSIFVEGRIRRTKRKIKRNTYRENVYTSFKGRHHYFSGIGWWWRMGWSRSRS